MRYLCSVFFFLVGVLAHAQYHTVQLVLEDANVGYAIAGSCAECSFESNDQGLNDVFLNHNVDWYQVAYPYAGDVLDLIQNVYYVGCDGCDVDQFLQDLNDYDSVIRIASLSDTSIEYFNHGLSLKLVDDTNGVYIGQNNGVVATSNSDLNQIFIDYNVSTYQLVFEDWEGWEQYQLFCECNAVQLKQEIDALDTVILSSDYLFMGLLLSNKDNALTETKIHPNPFKNSLSIDTHSQIKSFVLFDVLGKQVLVTKNKTILENRTTSLKQGFYILKITDVNNRTITRKLIKQ
jgi:hypothetical protein